MTQRPTRIKSAAFLRKRQWIQEKQPSFRAQSQLEIVALPVSESRYTIRPCEQEVKTRRKPVVSSRMASNHSVTSSMWRQVHSTRSEERLRSLSRGEAEEPVRINLLEKVDRLRSKNHEREIMYKKCQKAIAKKSLDIDRAIKSRGQLGDLQKRIHELLIPYEEGRIRADDRYKARLLRLRA